MLNKIVRLKYGVDLWYVDNSWNEGDKKQYRLVSVLNPKAIVPEVQENEIEEVPTNPIDNLSILV